MIIQGNCTVIRSVIIFYLIYNITLSRLFIASIRSEVIKYKLDLSTRSNLR